MISFVSAWLFYLPYCCWKYNWSISTLLFIHQLQMLLLWSDYRKLTKCQYISLVRICFPIKQYVLISLLLLNCFSPFLCCSLRDCLVLSYLSKNSSSYHCNETGNVLVHVQIFGVLIKETNFRRLWWNNRINYNIRREKSCVVIISL